MLNPHDNRLDYGQVLTPPPGYELDFAVGTSYSLDLDALVGASLALGLSEETDSALMNNPVCLLEALRSTGDKVALFCEGGQIHQPSRITPLYLLLEKMVFCVKPHRRRGIAAFPSFHPKFWLIRYQSAEHGVKYRIAVLSRNLTFDHSWDVTFYMDGHLKDTLTEKNAPVNDFLYYLLSQMPAAAHGKEKAKKIRAMIKELQYVVFEPEEKEFYDYQFIPNGVKKSNGGFYRFDETPLFTDTFHELLVVSPFVSGSIIRHFNEQNNASLIANSRYMLITREMSLGKLKPEDVTHFKMYTMKDNVIDGETAISEDASSVLKQDIHAKVYMVRKHTDTDLYLGSLNASHNAVYGNIEFMIRLRTKNRYLNMDRLSAALFCGAPDGPDNPFQEMTLQTVLGAEEDAETELNAVVKNINRSDPKAEVRLEENGRYSVGVHFGSCELQSMNVTVRPLLLQREESFAPEIIFSGLTLLQLSEFYVITVANGDKSISRVLMIPTEGIPEDREKAVVTDVVSDRDCFYRYIAFLLGDDSILSTIEINDIAGDDSSKARWQSYHIPALYEKMLYTAATNPQKFRGIEYLMKTISEDGIIPEEFKNLYTKFVRVVKING